MGLAQLFDDQTYIKSLATHRSDRSLVGDAADLTSRTSTRLRAAESTSPVPGVQTWCAVRPMSLAGLYSTRVRFTDLSPHTYCRFENPDGVVNVGWLGQVDLPKTVVGKLVPGGPVRNEEFTARLWHFCSLPVMQHRGYHDCELCPFRRARGPLPVDGPDGENLRLGYSVIMVFGDERTYAAPDLIWHYLFEHGYRPPAEFVTAVLESPSPSDPEYLERLTTLSPRDAEWFARSLRRRV